MWLLALLIIKGVIESKYNSFIITDKVQATLGEGTFGKVVRVKDLQT